MMNCPLGDYKTMHRSYNPRNIQISPAWWFMAPGDKRTATDGLPVHCLCRLVPRFVGGQKHRNGGFSGTVVNRNDAASPYYTAQVRENADLRESQSPSRKLFQYGLAR
jgi:hypothetical protein